MCVWLGGDEGSRGEVGMVMGNGGVMDSRDTHCVCSVELSACTKGEGIVIKGDDVGNTSIDDVKDVTKDVLHVGDVEGNMGSRGSFGFGRVDDSVTHVA